MKNRRTHDGDETENELLPSDAAEKRRRRVIYLIVTALNTVAIYGLYVILISAFPRYSVTIASVYMIALAIVSFGYVFYNRGFSRKNVTIEMLPDTWSEEEKHEYLSSAAERLQSSKWVLTILVPLIFTFFMELFIFYIYEPHLAPIFGNLF